MTSPGTIRTRAPAGLSLRPMSDEDLPFLADLYASTRREELAVTPWSDEQKAVFLKWQFDLQHQYYRQYYPNCEFLIVEQLTGSAHEPIGRLYVDRWANQIRLVDVSLVPGHRGQGHGTALLREVMSEGADAGLPVTIHVESTNPAMGLYRRLGFVHVDSNGVYQLMKWSPHQRR